jgi:hypothetical protein
MSIDIEDSGNGANSVLLGNGQPGTGRGKFVVNTSNAASLGNAASGTNMANATMREDMPDLAGNLRVDQAWGSAQIMAAIHNASGGYYSNVPGALGGAPSQVFGHPGEAWGWAVGGGAKFVNFLLPRDKLEFQINYCHGAYAYCDIPGLYTQNWMYGRANTLAMGYGMDGLYQNGGQVQLMDAFSFAVGYEHYWNQQWRTAVVGGQDYNMFNGNATSQLCGTAPGSQPFAGLYGSVLQTTGTVGGQTLNLNCSPNWSQTSVSTRTAWNPHPFLEIGLDLIWFHQHTMMSGSNLLLGANGARPAGVYKIDDQDGYAMVLRFQKNILP